MQKVTIEEVGRQQGFSDVVGLSWVDLFLLLQVLGRYFGEKGMQDAMGSMTIAEWAVVYRAVDGENKGKIRRAIQSLQTSGDYWRNAAAHMQSQCPELALICWEMALDGAQGVHDHLAIAYQASDDTIRARVHDVLRDEYDRLGSVTLLKLIACTSPGTSTHARIAHRLARETSGTVDRMVEIYSEVSIYPDHEEDLRKAIMQRLEHPRLSTILATVRRGAPLYLALLTRAQAYATGIAEFAGAKRLYQAVDGISKADNQTPAADAVRVAEEALCAACAVTMVVTAESRNDLLFVLRIPGLSSEDASAIAHKLASHCR